MILEKGQVQVSDKEREKELDSKFKDIATIVAEKSINRETKRPFSVKVIESAMKQIHFNVSASKAAKQQALLVIRELQEQKTIPIERAQMRIRIEVPSAIGKKIKKNIAASEIEEED